MPSLYQSRYVAVSVSGMAAWEQEAAKISGTSDKTNIMYVFSVSQVLYIYWISLDMFVISILSFSWTRYLGWLCA